MSREQEVSGQPDPLEEQKASARKAMLEKMDLREVIALSKRIGGNDLTDGEEKPLEANTILKELGYDCEEGSRNHPRDVTTLTRTIRAEDDKKRELLGNSNFSANVLPYNDDLSNEIKSIIVDSVILKFATKKSLEECEKLADDLYSISNRDAYKHQGMGYHGVKLSGPTQILKDTFKLTDTEVINKVYNKEKFRVYLTNKEKEKKPVELSLKQLTELHDVLNQRKSGKDQKYQNKSEYEIAEDIKRSKANKMIRSFVKNVAKMSSNVSNNVVTAVRTRSKSEGRTR